MKEYLPLGSVVTLKEGEKKLMSEDKTKKKKEPKKPWKRIEGFYQSFLDDKKVKAIYSGEKEGLSRSYTLIKEI